MIGIGFSKLLYEDLIKRETHAKQNVTDTVNLRKQNPDIADILGDEIGYSMELGAAEPWILLMGGSWMVNKRMNLKVEAVVGDRSRFLAGLDFRF